MNFDSPSDDERNASEIPVNDENVAPRGRGRPKGSRTINRTLTPSNTPYGTSTTRRRRQASLSSQSPVNKRMTRIANSQLTPNTQSAGNGTGSNTPSSTNAKSVNKSRTRSRIATTRKTNMDGLSEIEKFWGKDLSMCFEATSYQKMKIYQDLKEKINKISRTQLVEEIDTKVDEEVLNSKDEDVEEWDEMYKNSSNSVYELDYVVSCTKRNLGEKPTQILLKYEKYPRPSWEEASDHSGHELANFRLNLYLLDRVELRLRAQWGDKYEEKFPNRYLEYEDGVGNGRYITTERSIYINKIKAIQWRMNFILRKYGLAEILIEDWTSFTTETAEEDLNSLLNFKFTPFLKADSAVRNLLQEYKLENEIKCTDECKTCSHDVNVMIHRKCCGLQGMLEFDEDNQEVSFREKPDKEAIKKRPYVTIECVKGICQCGDGCKNRASQIGRQFNYVIFKEAGKGWTLRTLSQMKKADFVGEYAGKASIRKSSTKISQSYDMRMAYSLRLKNNQQLPPITIRGYKCGNETRFISHSCKPNLVLEMAMVSRNGLWYAKHLFRAKRFILPGEELTFDYVHEEEDAEIRVYFDYCLCGTDKCRYTKEIMDAKEPIDPELTSEWKDESEDESEDEEEELNTNREAVAGEMEDEQSRRRRRIIRERSPSVLGDGEEENGEQNDISNENNDDEEEEEERENDENRQPDDTVDASSVDETHDQGENGRPQNPPRTLESVADDLADLRRSQSDTNQSVHDRIAKLEREQQKMNERCKKLEEQNKELLKENIELRRQ